MHNFYVNIFIINHQFHIHCKSPGSFEVLYNSDLFNFVKLHHCKSFHVACGHCVLKMFLSIHCFLPDTFI